MCRTTWYKAIAAVACLAAVSFAQAPGTQNRGVEGKETTVETDVIFDEILQSLPVRLRAEVDSAKHACPQSKQAPDAAAIRQRTEDRERLCEEELNKLPEQLRQQVEKTIERMDENLQQRQAQFKEQKGDVNRTK